MINLSFKQEKLKNYLLKRLGFNEDTFFTNYIKQLEISSPKFRYLEAEPAEYYEVTFADGTKRRQLKEIGPFKGLDQKRDLVIPIYFNIVNFLQLEVKIKSKRQVKTKTFSSSSISATDISNYTYCPVSYSISKSFDLLKLESVYLAIDFHEEHRLFNLLTDKTNQSITIRPNSIVPRKLFINANNQYFFDDVANSKIIYCGHINKSHKEYFKSLKGKFIGQPDYIFENSDQEKFVVEEKFKYKNTNKGINPKDKTFYDNHINQLLSYMHGISEHDIKYGYLVYWKYSLNGEQSSIHTCNVLRLTKSEETRIKLNSIYSSIKSLNDTKSELFDIHSRDPGKCANCVTNLICGHKTGKYNTLTLPYKFDYMQLNWVAFPEELKKDQTKPRKTISDQSQEQGNDHHD